MMMTMNDDDKKLQNKKYIFMYKKISQRCSFHSIPIFSSLSITAHFPLQLTLTTSLSSSALPSVDVFERACEWASRKGWLVVCHDTFKGTRQSMFLMHLNALISCQHRRHTFVLSLAQHAADESTAAHETGEHPKNATSCRYNSRCAQNRGGFV
jgi:hypothetical protein